MATYKILSEESYQGDAGSELIRLGGCSDNGNDDDWGLGEWTYQFEIEATNKSGETRKFTIALQPTERNDGMMAYAGWELSSAGDYGYDADETDALLEFCDDDTSIFDELKDKAETVASIELERMIDELNS